MDIPRNLSTADAVKIARRLGCTVTKTPSLGGEWLFVTPDGHRDRQNARRKDANMKIVSMLRRLAKGQIPDSQ